ncbi:MAG: hypothetical protein KBS55_01845 [Bacteroidales bacterium]|nr:hypothetical protein [Candidatus Cryptobacteroides aphodequi]
MKNNKKDILAFTQNPKTNKIVTWAAMPVLIVVIAVLLVSSIMQPVLFNKEKARREAVGIERLKDIRTLQNAYKSVYNKYTWSVDTLVKFYNEGELVINLQVGSKDDSIAFAHTQSVKQQVPWLKGEDLERYLYQKYNEGDRKLVFSLETKVPVRDTLFNGRPGFCVDSLRTIPFSGGKHVQMDATLKMVSGVKVPLFEAKMPYRYLLPEEKYKQLRINLDSERRNSNHYEGLQVGSISAPNNNAGNWE